MNPSRLFILRPVGTSLLMVAILLAGIVAYRFLPLSALPQVDYPTIQVQTFYPGASPEVMTSAVTAPLEVQFGQMPGLNQMSSTSSGGASVITLQFSLSLTLDVAEQEVQAAINAAGNLLPSDLPTPPIYAKINPADVPVLTLALSSKSLSLPQIEDFAETRLAQKISQLSGVGVVRVVGGQRPAVRVQANVRALAAYGLNIDDLRTTINNANVNLPKGSFDGPARAYAVNANDQLQSADSYRSIVVAYRNGAPVRRGRRDRRRREPEARRLEGQHARHRGEHPAPARGQRHPGRESGQSAPAPAPELAAAVHRHRGADRPHQHDSRLRPRRELRADAGGGAGRPRDLSIPRQLARHRHSEPGGAALARRDVRRHVPRRLQPEQPLADGADHRHRLRRGRCHRDDREHQPLHREG